MVAAGTMPAPPSRRRDGRRAGHQPQEPVGAHEAAGDRLSCRPGAAGLDHIGMMAVLGRMAVARSGAGGDARGRRIDRASFVRRASAVLSWPCPEARWTREPSAARGPAARPTRTADRARCAARRRSPPTASGSRPASSQALAASHALRASASETWKCILRTRRFSLPNSPRLAGTWRGNLVLPGSPPGLRGTSGWDGGIRTKARIR